mgnify:CR=1 FL=1
MDNFNNLYNFKNPIRHFFNLDNFNFDNSEDLKFEDLTWTLPVKFKIFKTEDSLRTISFPNILNYYHAVKNFESEDNYFNIKQLSAKKRVSPDLTTGEFSVMSYYKCVQTDMFNLTKYDKLMIMDIKSFYGRIYTRDLGYESSDPKKLEQRVGSLNNGRTNGLLLGSYLSLFLAEKFLLNIEIDLDNELSKHKIDCHYEYFSDDFYFFCNKCDMDKIKEIFSKVLDSYELQVNYDKTLILDFEQYTKDNNLEKLWKKIIKISTEKDSDIARAKDIQKDYVDYPAFFTQIVYKLSQIHELKYKRIFLANFFKTFYFYNLKPEYYRLSDSDFNYICYIYKLMPETILYSLSRIKNIHGFNRQLFKDFVYSRFKSALQTEKYEEQIYFYYAIKECAIDDRLVDFKDDVMVSKNQILISYFLIDRIILKSDYQCFVDNPKEDEWLQNYHYLLVYDKSNLDLLIPNQAKNNKKQKSYFDFYKVNLDNNIPIVRNINKIAEDINKFVALKISSYSH